MLGIRGQSQARALIAEHLSKMPHGVFCLDYCNL